MFLVLVAPQLPLSLYLNQRGAFWVQMCPTVCILTEIYRERGFTGATSKCGEWLVVHSGLLL